MYNLNYCKSLWIKASVKCINVNVNKETTLDLTQGRILQEAAEGESQEEGSILGQSI